MRVLFLGHAIQLLTVKLNLKAMLEPTRSLFPDTKKRKLGRTWIHSLTTYIIATESTSLLCLANPPPILHLPHYVVYNERLFLNRSFFFMYIIPEMP